VLKGGYTVHLVAAPVEVNALIVKKIKPISVNQNEKELNRLISISGFIA
jgi:hypothetical protein